MDDHDREAFRVFYRSHYRTVCRYLSSRTDADLVEDVAAEVFLVAWRRWRELPVHAVPWLLNTASKCLANQRRARERSSSLVERLGRVTAGPEPSIEQDLTRDAQRRALLTALAALKDQERELLMLRHWDGLPARQIAAVLGLNAVLIRTRLHRAQGHLKRELRRALEAEHGLPHPVETTDAA